MTKMQWYMLIGLAVSPVGCSMPIGMTDGNTNANTSTNTNSGTDDANVNDNSADGETPSRFEADLTGDAEQPPVETTMSGSIGLIHTPVDDSLFVRFGIVGSGITQMHIHLGGPDENGPVVAFLYQAADQLVGDDGVVSSARLTADDLINDLAGATISDLVDEFIAGNAYVNVHTIRFPGGEIRGQAVIVDE